MLFFLKLMGHTNMNSTDVSTIGFIEVFVGVESLIEIDGFEDLVKLYLREIMGGVFSSVFMDFE
jgi:hypothetical protein